MAININSGFSIGTPQPIDSRNVLSKEAMKNINENVWPDTYFATCKDDGKLYVFNKSNELSDETGKFRLVTENSLTDADMEIGEDISSTQDIGLLASGTKIKSTASIKDILLNILTGSGPKTTTVTDNNTTVTEESKLDGGNIENASNETGSYDITTDSDGTITKYNATMTGSNSKLTATTKDSGETIVVTEIGTTTDSSGDIVVTEKLELTYDKNGDLIKSRFYK